MKNLLISSLLFALSIITIHITLNQMKIICKEYLSDLNQIEILLNKNEFEESYKKSLILLNKWIKHTNYSSILFNHIEIELVSSEFMRVTQFIKCNGKADALSSIHAIKFYIEAIMDLQNLNLGNIL